MKSNAKFAYLGKIFITTENCHLAGLIFQLWLCSRATPLQNAPSLNCAA
jgi:hypothetical protein